MDAYQSAFGRHIRYIRMLQGSTQEEVAHRAGIHVTYLSGIERGQRNPSLKNIRAIAKAMNVNTADLFSFEPESSSE
ncbi:MAG: helix-turn-helix transcriptional regulator [Chloroflexota bacterium]|nr:helix-turn-helix transcriptional regulator [Chloroflexota bacterium]MDE2941282.1 helix-turn-helix transcriptional regulator [Chloroflexota bacterium]MDE3267784.1 helix-turn-helix transcriptional regulator [Chloroflexota bacterium]